MAEVVAAQTLSRRDVDSDTPLGLLEEFRNESKRK